MTKDNKLILIVEDEQALANVFQLKLKSAGYNAVVANSGPEALDFCKEKTPSLIFLDIFMPMMSGFETLVAMRKMPNLKDLPIIIFSNSGREEELEAGKKLGSTDYLIKASFTMDDLVEKVRKYLK